MKRACMILIACLLLSGFARAEAYTYAESPLQFLAVVSAEEGHIYDRPWGGKMLATISKGTPIDVAFFGGDWSWLAAEFGGEQGYIRVREIEAVGLEETFANRDGFVYEERPEYGESDLSVRRYPIKEGAELLVIGWTEPDAFGQVDIAVLDEGRGRAGRITSRDYLGEIPPSWSNFSDCLHGYVLGDARLYDASGDAVGELHRGNTVHIVESVGDMYYVTNGAGANAYILRGMVSLWYVHPERGSDIALSESTSWDLGWDSP